MRKVAGVVGAAALTLAAAAWVGLPVRAGAQGGGTIEVEVRYNGAPVIEDIKVNKDVEVCGKEKRIDKIGVGPNKGLADTLAWDRHQGPGDVQARDARPEGVRVPSAGASDDA